MGRVMLTILAVGRMRNSAMRTLVENYLERCGRAGMRVRVDEVAEDKGGAPRNPSAIQDRMNRSSCSIVLDERGEALDSLVFATQLEKDLSQNRGDVVFVIGGAAGLSPEIVKAADRVLSLSAFTLPHELARVVIAEQVYRAASILRGLPYHRGS